MQKHRHTETHAQTHTNTHTHTHTDAHKDSNKYSIIAFCKNATIIMNTSTSDPCSGCISGGGISKRIVNCGNEFVKCKLWGEKSPQSYL